MWRSRVGITLTILLLVTFLPVLIGTDTKDVSVPATIHPANRKVFTWISKVTPELARWTKDMHFTDVISSDNSTESYTNLVNEGITYWYLVTAFDIANTTNIGALECQMTEVLEQSPSNHVYIDDTHQILMRAGDGGSAFNSLLEAIRSVQKALDCHFILDGFINDYVTDIYLSINLADIDFDAYQRAVDSYASVVPVLMRASPKSLGVYIWAYCTGGISWDTMTNDYLSLIYAQAMNLSVERVIVWNGHTDVSQSNSYMYNACLYNYPEWKDEVRAENMKFIEGTR